MQTRSAAITVEKPKAGDVLTIVSGKMNDLQKAEPSSGDGPTTWFLTVNPGNAAGYEVIIKKTMELFGQRVADWSYSVFRDKTLWGANKEWLGKQVSAELKS